MSKYQDALEWINERTARMQPHSLYSYSHSIYDTIREALTLAEQRDGKTNITGNPNAPTILRGLADFAVRSDYDGKHMRKELFAALNMLTDADPRDKTIVALADDLKRAIKYFGKFDLLGLRSSMIEYSAEIKAARERIEK